MTLRSLWYVIVIVFVSSTVSSYLTAGGTYVTLWLREQGYSGSEIATYYMRVFIVSTISGYGLLVLILVATYMAGKHYVLTKPSSVMFFLFLVVTILCGSLAGYVIRQIEIPLFPILNISIFWEIQSLMLSRIILSFLGMLAGNYTRARAAKED